MKGLERLRGSAQFLGGNSGWIAARSRSSASIAAPSRSRKRIEFGKCFRGQSQKIRVAVSAILSFRSLEHAGNPEGLRSGPAVRPRCPVLPLLSGRSSSQASSSGLIQSERGSGMLTVNAHLHAATTDGLFQQQSRRGASLRVQLRRQMEVQIQAAVVHGFQGKRQVAGGDSGKTCHAAAHTNRSRPTRRS